MGIKEEIIKLLNFSLGSIMKRQKDNIRLDRYQNMYENKENKLRSDINKISDILRTTQGMDINVGIEIMEITKELIELRLSIEEQINDDYISNYEYYILKLISGIKLNFNDDNNKNHEKHMRERVETHDNIPDRKYIDYKFKIYYFTSVRDLIDEYLRLINLKKREINNERKYDSNKYDSDEDEDEDEYDSDEDEYDSDEDEYDSNEDDSDEYDSDEYDSDEYDSDEDEDNIFNNFHNVAAAAGGKRKYIKKKKTKAKRKTNKKKKTKSKRKINKKKNHGKKSKKHRK